MPIFQLRILIFFLLVAHLPLFIKAGDTDVLNNYNCSGDDYQENSSFQTNVNLLFSILTSKVPSLRFFNSSSGEGFSRAYGQFLCRGDVTLDQCRVCVQTAITVIASLCPLKTQGSVWSEYCQLRYSDENFPGKMDSNGFNSVNVIYNPDNAKAVDLIKELIKEAPNRPSMFSTAASPAHNAYGLVECTKDLTRDDCSKCLAELMEKLSLVTSYRRWSYYAGSCNIRLKPYPFFNGSRPHDDLLKYNCTSDITRFTSAFNTSLTQLLSSLASKAPQTSGFFSDTSGETRSSNRLYGMGLCRGDLSPESCRNCLEIAGDEIREYCPGKTQAIVYYDNCLLRYSDEIIEGIVNTKGFSMRNDENLDSPETNALVLMNRLVERASTQRRMFSAENQTFGQYQTRYGAVQCTRDLNSTQCADCLSRLKSELMICCNGRKGWRFLAPSCTIRYEAYPFYNYTKVENLASQPIPSPSQPATNPGGTRNGRNRSKLLRILIPSTVATALGLGLLVSLAYYSQKGKENSKGQEALPDTHFPNGGTDGGTQELPLVDLATIQVATNNFSNENKLGEGGFGPVYKGILNGKEVAVKRLSKTSGQGLLEFKNEAMMIAKLQHNNLVRLLCCCIEREEKLLVYEFMPNTSLDGFLFDPKKSVQLDWQRRINIIKGIARGLMYLHEDSRLRIIHRDMKASNVLLDHEMNPKISDFGMAKIFGGDQNQASTNRVVGTYGYMAPEYAMQGLFSVKSDVFSFGVLLLEIVSGKKNTGFYRTELAESLLEYAWKLWSDNNGLKLVDPVMAESCPADEALKCIHIGLLCVQQDAVDRPTMSSVVVMLVSNSMTLPQPTQPAFSVGRGVINPEQSTTSGRGCSINEMTMSNVEPR